MADKKAVQLKPYTRPEIRELGTGDAQSVALLMQIARAAAGSMNNALHALVLEIALLRNHFGHLDRAEAEHLTRLTATANWVVRLSRVIFGADEPILDEAYSNRIEEQENAG